MTTAIEDDMLQPAPARLQPLLNVPQAYPEPTEEFEVEGPDETSAFDQRYREPFLGLLYLGKLSKRVTHFGHSFQLDTPSQNERIESGMLHKPYLNSLSAEISWAAITVACYLRNVDGSSLPEPIGPKESGLQARLEWVLENLHGHVIEKLFEECLDMETESRKVLEELDNVGKA